jgi:thymidine kinase
MNTPHKNYKYRTLESALLDLLDESVFFAKHSAFHLTNVFNTQGILFNCTLVQKSEGK